MPTTPVFPSTKTPPEANYLAAVNRNQRTLLGVIGLVTGLTAGAAVLMADRLIARPVLGIARTAAAIETGKFELDQLGAIAGRTDEIGQLARVFDRMAQEVYTREQRLKQQVRDLRIEIDEAKRKKQVKDIVETDFFQPTFRTLKCHTQVLTLQAFEFKGSNA
jgi:HAMP domain-containing protein